MMILVLMPIVLLASVLPASSYAQTSLQHVVVTYSSRSIASIDLCVPQERAFFASKDWTRSLCRSELPLRSRYCFRRGPRTGFHRQRYPCDPAWAAIKVLAVSLRRPVFWLVSRPELKSFNDLKGKIMGTTTIGASQHTAGVRLLRKAGLNPDKDLTVVLGADMPTQLQALVNGSIQVGILSPPTVIVARDQYKMNILGNAMDEFTSIQNGLAVLDKSLKDQRDLMKRILRARAKANRYFHQNERGTSEVWRSI